MSNDAKDPNKGKRRSSEWWGKADKDRARFAGTTTPFHAYLQEVRGDWA